MKSIDYSHLKNSIMTTGKWFGLMCLFAFGGILSFVQIDSYRADKYNLNTLYIVLTAVGALLALFCLSKVAKSGSANDSGI